MGLVTHGWVGLVTHGWVGLVMGDPGDHGLVTLWVWRPCDPKTCDPVTL